MAIQFDGKLAEFSKLIQNNPATDAPWERTSDIVQFNAGHLAVTPPEKFYVTYAIRDQANTERNNTTRDMFMEAIKEFFGSDIIPEDVRDAMKAAKFDDKGRPLTVRRIKDTLDAISRKGAFPYLSASQNVDKDVFSYLGRTLGTANVRSADGVKGMQESRFALRAALDHIDEMCAGVDFNDIGDDLVTAGEMPIRSMAKKLREKVSAALDVRSRIGAEERLQLFNDLFSLAERIQKRTGELQKHPGYYGWVISDNGKIATKALKGVCDSIVQILKPSLLNERLQNQNAQGPQPVAANEPRNPPVPRVAPGTPLAKVNPAGLTFEQKEIYDILMSYKDDHPLKDDQHLKDDQPLEDDQPLKDNQPLGFVFKQTLTRDYEKKQDESIGDDDESMPMLNIGQIIEQKEDTDKTLVDGLDKALEDIWQDWMNADSEMILQLVKEVDVGNVLESGNAPDLPVTAEEVERMKGLHDVTGLFDVLGHRFRMIDRVIINRVYENLKLPPFFNADKTQQMIVGLQKSELRKYDAKIGKPAFGPLDKMFKDDPSLGIALEILRLLDADSAKFKGDSGNFLSMLADAVDVLRAKGFDHPLTREKLYEAFSVPLQAGEKIPEMDKSAFTRAFLSRLDGRIEKFFADCSDGQNVLHMTLTGMRYGSACEMCRNPLRGVKKEDFFVMPNPIMSIGPNELNASAQFLENRISDLGKDLNRTSNICFTFGGEVLLVTDSKKNWTVPNLEKSEKTLPSEVQNDAAKAIARKIREKVPQVKDLQLAQLLCVPMQTIGAMMKTLSPKLGAENLNINCSSEENGDIRVSVTPRANEQGELPEVDFKLEFTIDQGGQTKILHMQSGNGAPIKLEDWAG